MNKLNLSLNRYTKQTELQLIDVLRKQLYENGEPTGRFYTSYLTPINYEMTEIRIDDDGEIAKEVDKIQAYAQNGEPLKVSFENCIITISPKSQYELSVRGTASKATIIAPVKQTKTSQE
ncbi:hypothetical protein LJB88_04745 [Erysipelotrichaceae bacterium OttesenSCG-928-M19]|nr:hypothetical protein [Erysipelotrichaceae bacterium OttesenSCG-928-M19]